MTVLPLPEAFDQRAASEFSKSLMACRGDSIAIDAGAVKKLSAISIELLIAALNQWKNDRCDFVIRNCSKTFMSTLETLGIAPMTLNIEHFS